MHNGLLIFIIVLILKYSHLKSVLENLFNECLEIIPEPSYTIYLLKYTKYSVYFNNTRFFMPITDGMILTSSEDSIEAKNLLITAVTDIRLDLNKGFYYPDFLLEFNISNVKISKIPHTKKYQVESLILNNLFISSAHDLKASAFFREFSSDSKGILDLFNGIIMTRFNTAIEGQHKFDDLMVILEMMKNALINYKFNKRCDDYKIIYSYCTADSFALEANHKPIAPSVIFEGIADFKTTFTIDSIDSEKTEKKLFTTYLRITYDINTKYGVEFLGIDYLPICIRKQYIDLINKTFIEQEKEYNKKTEDNNLLICLNTHSNPFLN